jgi:hypothetical protein
MSLPDDTDPKNLVREALRRAVDLRDETIGLGNQTNLRAIMLVDVLNAIAQAYEVDATDLFGTFP